MVDCVGGDGEDGALGEVVGVEGYAGARGNDAGEAEGGGGVDAEGFFDYFVEAEGWGLIKEGCGDGSGAMEAWCDEKGRGIHTRVDLSHHHTWVRLHRPEWRHLALSAISPPLQAFSSTNIITHS